jgi:Ni,Fe-hydrogenase I cytochrome b subunit
MERQPKDGAYRGSIWNQIKQYLFLKKRDPNEPRNVNIFLMHGMNRISILIFLVALILIIIRAFMRH